MAEGDRIRSLIAWIRTRRSRDIDHEIATAMECMLAEIQTLSAENSGSRDKLEIAYSEICFAVHDLAGERSQNYEMRSERLAKFADEIREFLDGTVSTRPFPDDEFPEFKKLGRVTGICAEVKKLDLPEGLDDD